MGSVVILKVLLYYLLYPIFVIVKWIGIILLALAAPFINTAYYVLLGCVWPLRFLARLETLSIFLGVAMLLGVLTGTTLHYASKTLAALLNLESRPHEEPRGRTMASYRAERTKKLQRKAISRSITQAATAPKMVDTTSADDFAHLLERQKRSGRRSLLISTILEEDDSSNGVF
ncbi:MAG: hypothetical protein L6R40_001725 [Gallowayella cf. fulva]|nr:MAG: hypothetical protein L6R40_001725 [Xanthomendoza cf. fulva]